MSISIRSIQHFLYCPHRWGLLEIERAWAENYFVVKANILHERVHSAEQYASRGSHVFTAVRVWNDTYGLYGETDCLEEKDGRYTIVEYKPTAPRSGTIREEDKMQLFAQKLCVDAVFSTDCQTKIYYADTRKRIEVSFAEEYAQYEERLRETLQSMRNFREHGTIPKIQKGQNCNGCSMKELCLPSAFRKRNHTKDLILQLAEEVT